MTRHLKSFFLILCTVALIAAPANAGTQAECTRVIDGDTIAVDSGDGAAMELDLEGIDAPEPDQEKGDQARDFLSDLVLGKKIELDILHPEADPPVARVLVDGKDVGLELLAAGLAWIGDSDREDYALASITARSSKKGLWASRRPMPPWAWRNRRPIPTPTPTPPPTIRSLSEMATRTQLEKNRKGKTVIEGLPQVRAEQKPSAEPENSTKTVHVDFSCSPKELQSCVETQFKAAFEKAAGKSTGSLSWKQVKSEGGNNLLTFDGDGFSIPVNCQCPKDEDCSCSLDIKMRGGKKAEPPPEEKSESDDPEAQTESVEQ